MYIKLLWHPSLTAGFNPLDGEVLYRISTCFQGRYRMAKNQLNPMGTAYLMIENPFIIQSTLNAEMEVQ